MFSGFCLIVLCLSFGENVRSDHIEEKVPTKINAVIGSTVKLECGSGCEAPCTYRWFKLGEAGETRRLPQNAQPQDGSLVIKSVTSQNYGSYVCIGRGSKGISKTRIELVAPFSVSLNAQRVFYGAGDCIKVECHVDGSDGITLEWLKDENPIRDSSISLQDKDDQLDLVIYFALYKHQGYYTCRGKKGTETVTANVTIVYDNFAEKSHSANFC